MRTGRRFPAGWTAPLLWRRPPAPPFQSEPGATPVRLTVRRVKPTPGSQLALFAAYSYHGFITDRDGDTLELEADHRRHAEVENAIRDLKHGVGLNHLPSGRFAANGAWLAVQVLAHNLARWAARIGLGEATATTKTLRRRFFSLAGRLTRSARRLTLHLPKGWPWEYQFSRAWPGCKQFHSRPDRPAPTGLTIQTIEHPPREHSHKLAPTRAASVSLAAWFPVNLTQRRHCGPPLEHRTTASGRHRPPLLEPNLNRCVPTPIIPRLASMTTPLRWIWANGSITVIMAQPRVIKSGPVIWFPVVRGGFTCWCVIEMPAAWVLPSPLNGGPGSLGHCSSSKVNGKDACCSLV